MSLNSFLTPAMHKFLSAIRACEDGYAIQEGIEVWAGLDRFHASTVNKCLLLCLISQDGYSDDTTRIWVLNEDGEKCLDDENYVPGIVKALAGAAHAGGGTN